MSNQRILWIPCQVSEIVVDDVDDMDLVDDMDKKNAFVFAPHRPYRPYRPLCPYRPCFFTNLLVDPGFVPFLC